MTKIRIGILGTSEIAYRRFLPALKKSSVFEYVGVASRDLTKTDKFVKEYGGRGFSGYEEAINSSEIDALYIPLPPALHHFWAKKALEQGKHVLLEKPFTTNIRETQELIEIAKRNKLALSENYMFVYHKQLNIIKQIIESGQLGRVRNYRIAFGFPKRGSEDFRYNKALGGGALLDCGGYTIKLATLLLGSNTKVVCSSLNYEAEYEVDIFGTAVLENEIGITAQVAFGMDNAYQCELEVWGSKARLNATRIFTAGDGFSPEIVLQTATGKESISIEPDDQFLNAINAFGSCIADCTERGKVFQEIITQAKNMESIMKHN